MATLYIETSIVSYLRQRPSLQVVMAARQLLTHQWWDAERVNYQLVTSQYVLDEVSNGDPDLAVERLQSLEGFHSFRLILRSESSPAKSYPVQFFHRRHPLMRCTSPWLPITGYNTS